jgi:hypothetical protein
LHYRDNLYFFSADQQQLFYLFTSMVGWAFMHEMKSHFIHAFFEEENNWKDK